jgi:hypothetical protein
MGLHKQQSSMIILKLQMNLVNNSQKIHILLDQLSCGEQTAAAIL